MQLKPQTPRIPASSIHIEYWINLKTKYLLSPMLEQKPPITPV